MRCRTFILGIFLMLLFFSGCAKHTGGEEAVTDMKPTDTSVREVFSWQTEEFGIVGEDTVGKQIYINDYMSNVIGTSDFSNDFEEKLKSVYGDCLYTWRNYYISQEEGLSVRYFLDIYNYKEKTLETREILYEKILKEGKIAVPRTFQVLDENQFVLTIHYNNEENLLSESYVLYMDNQGNVTETVDIYPIVSQLNLIPEPSFRFQGTVLADNRGYIYVCSYAHTNVTVADKTGTVIATMKPRAPEENGVKHVLTSPEGIPIFEVSDYKAGKNTLFYYDDVTNDMKIMTQTGWDTDASKCMNQYGEIFYIKDDYLMRWNAKAGTKERVFNLRDSAIGTNTYWQTLFTDTKGTVYLLDNTVAPEYLYRFSETPIAITNSIKIENISYHNSYISGCAAEFSRFNPGCDMIYHNDSSEANRTRVIADMVAGNGPDILIVDRADMMTLYEKGALTDMEAFINEDMKENIFPALLRAGEIDGTQIAFVTSFSVMTMFVNSDIWNQDSWTIEELVGYIRENEKKLEEPLKHELWSYMRASNLLDFIALSDLQDSPFIDWENKTCDFDSELFRQVMELCKKYHQENKNVSFNGKSLKKALEAVNNNTSVALVANVYNFKDFSDLMSYVGEDCYAIGMPTESQNGNFFIVEDGFIVVNKNSEQGEYIGKFLQFCFTKEKQRAMGVETIRKDVLETYVILPDWSDSPEFSLGGGKFDLIAGKEDGTSYLEEYFAFIDKCRAEPAHVSVVSDIISEEAEQYFNGQYDLDKVIDIIESRVQLYLDERK